MMTPADFIDMLRHADAEEVAEIRRLLGVSAAGNLPEMRIIGSEPVLPKRIGGMIPDSHFKLLKDVPAPGPGPLEPRDPTQRGTV